MKEMTAHERMTRVYEHREPDRVPIGDAAWESTIARWHQEGLPRSVPWDRYLGLDLIVVIPIDTSPRFPVEIIKETETYRIERDEWGVTKKNFKPVRATFEHLNNTVKDRKSWEIAKERMTPSEDRVDWQQLERFYSGWRKEGAWILTAPWFGYDIVNARMCDTATILYAMAEDPDWIKEMCDHGCDLSISMLDMLWEKGYTFDEVWWFDDMAYRNGMIFSKEMWRAIVRPYQKRTVDWAHAHGIKAHLHCCGRILELIPELIELGIDALNPLEVKAGMNPVAIKKEYGRDLVLRGGFDVQHWSNPQKVEEEIRTILPIMMESGGYVFSSDHSIPDSVSLIDYAHIIKLVKEVGAYR